MKTPNDPVFEPETTGEKIADFIGTFLSLFFIVLVFMTILTLITIIGVELGIAVWGDANVNYWISNLF